MTTYTSKPVSLTGAQADVYDKISNLGAYQGLLDQMPDDLRQKAGDVRFTDDSIIINATPVGEMRFDVNRREAPELLEFKAADAPVPMLMGLHLAPGEESATTTLTATIDVEVPAIVRPMIGPKMQEAADQMARLVSQLFNR